jgi:hypothetical protein
MAGPKGLDRSQAPMNTARPSTEPADGGHQLPRVQVHPVHLVPRSGHKTRIQCPNPRKPGPKTEIPITRCPNSFGG